MPSIASVGNLNYDVYIKTPELPGLDQSVDAVDLYTGGGGSAANFSVAAARMGLRAKFIGAVGDDFMGDLILRELAGEGVDVSRVKRIKGVRSGVVVVIVHPDGGKRMIAYRGANMGLSPDDLSEESLGDVDHVHVASGRLELVLKAKEVAKRLGKSVSVDGGTALARKGLEVVSRALADVDVVFMNQAEAKLLASSSDHRTALDVLAKHIRAREVVVTLGDKGAVAVSDGEFIYVDAFRLQPVDTTGAGDAFAAAYVAARLKGLSLYERLLFANAAASLKVTRPGARSSPKYEEVIYFLQSLGYRIGI
ncbi:MAG: carbohydrate kinase family protein [Thermoproteus sp.]|nr:carbohydrate kinase family protein [Thermoproteus sp.]